MAYGKAKGGGNAKGSGLKLGCYAKPPTGGYGYLGPKVSKGPSSGKMKVGKGK